MLRKTALIVGATGLIGRYLLQDLLADVRYERVIAIVRRPLALSHSKLEEVQVDFEKLSDHLQAITADDVFCCLGTTMKQAGSREAFTRIDYHYPLELGRIMRDKGATQYLLVSAIGSSPTSSFFYSRTKGALERDLRALAYNGLHVFKPSLLLGVRDHARSAEDVAGWFGRRTARLFAGPLHRYRPVQGETVARAMSRVAALDRQGVHDYHIPEIERYANA